MKKLEVSQRKGLTKAEVKSIRREGNIPAVLYAPHGKQNEMITVKGVQFEELLRGIPQGHLPTTVFTLHLGGQKEKKVVVKDIQYHVTTYRVIHLDFLEITEGCPVQVKVPIVCIGSADCVGVKAGGVLKQIQRYVKVECDKQIPFEFVINVAGLESGQSIRLGGIPLPKGARLLAPAEEIAVLVARKAAQ